jgi:hypothetical protein
MLVVLAADRSSSIVLKDKLNTIYKKCMETTDYCIKRVSTTIVRVTTAVEANLNENAREIISKRKPKLSIHEGRAPRKSLHPNEMKEAD